MRNEIIKRLHEIEARYNIRILHACESGSRAWGFPSPDSDYDVRFIYIHDEDWYLSIEDKKDSIEVPINDELDISGWEIRKALRLFRKSNVPVLEHLQSPIVYVNTNDFYKELYNLQGDYFSPRASLHHYLSMAKNSANSFNGEKVKLKRYFYVLRTMLAALWIVDNGTMPPLQFYKLLPQISKPEVIDSIRNLLEIKGKENEPYMQERLGFLEDFIAETLEYCEAGSDKFEKKITQSDELNVLFRKYLHCLNH